MIAPKRFWGQLRLQLAPKHLGVFSAFNEAGPFTVGVRLYTRLKEWIF